MASEGGYTSMLDIVCCDCGDYPAWTAAGSHWWQELNDGDDHDGDHLGRCGVFPGGQVMQRRTPSSEVVKILADATLVLALISDAFRIGLHPLRANLRLCLRLLA
jgi:hypothetical protein